MEYQLHDFLPLYHQAFNVQSVDFDKDVNNLAEFVDLKLTKEEDFPQQPGDLLLHQRLISRFISPRTPYDGLLLVHEMGTGKTCTAVAVAENFINNPDITNITYPYSEVRTIIVLTKGKGLQNNFVSEIANVCTKNKYLHGLDKYVSNRDKKIKKNVKTNYTFDTFEVFAKKLKKMSAEEMRLNYENSLFIVDEAHNLRMSSNVEESNIYRKIYELFQVLQHRRILLLTGTPMKDKPEEIVDLLNLIVKEKLSVEDLNDERAFKRKVKGYVSYLRVMMSDINRTEEGVLLGSLKHFKVYPVVMDPFQSENYALAKRKDEQEKSIFNYSRQAASIVFPDKTYGKNGFEKNIIRTSSGHRFSSTTKTELQANLSRYSIKYSNLLKNLSFDYSNGRLAFVFSEFVKGSGLIALSLILEANGYYRATVNSNLTNPQKRYVVFTNETSNDADTKKLISVFNNPKNANGAFISVILGSKVIMEGFSFKNIQSEYIMTPHWNYSETSQIIARGLRLGSHNALLQMGVVVPEIKIFQYVALPQPFRGTSTIEDESASRDGKVSVEFDPSSYSKNQLKDSIDLLMYEISERKDFAIQKVIRLLKTAAFDCGLNKARNLVSNTNLDYTRECEYTNCDYECDGGDPSEVDDRNFRLLYFKTTDSYRVLKKQITDIVTHNSVTLNEMCEVTGRSKFEVLCVVQDLVDFQEVLFSRPEGAYYMSVTKNLFYASSNKHVEKDEDPSLLAYYSRYATVFVGKTIDNLIYDNQKNYMVNLILQIFQSSNLKQLSSFVIQLPIYLQEKLLVYSVSLKNTNTLNNFVRDMVLNHFKLYYEIEGDTGFIWLDAESYKCNSTITNPTSWKVCEEEEQARVEQFKEMRRQKVLSSENNPYGYIGLLNRNSNDFCLKKTSGGAATAIVDKRKKHVGKRCQNWSKEELVDLVSNRLQIVEDDDNFDFDINSMKQNPKFKNLMLANGTLKDHKRMAFWNGQDVQYLCSKIMQNFIDKRLVVDDPNCGTSKKQR